MTTSSQERVIATTLIGLMLVLWMGFLLHASARFAGSAIGGAFAVSAAALMLVPLGYSAAKRIGPLHSRTSNMRSLLGWHIYSGLLASLLALIHTGHKFDSILGIALTTTMLLTTFSGFVGQHYHTFVTTDKNAKEKDLAVLYARLHALNDALQMPAAANLRLDESAFQLEPLAEAIADLEYAIHVDEKLNMRFRGWLRLHIAASVLLYVLLGLHVWAGIEFGLRWFE